MAKEYSEDDLRMIRLQDGDPDAVDEIVAAWKGPLYGFFMRNTKDPQQSEDLVQDTFLRLYRKAWDYLPTGRFKGWLFRVARNLLIDSVRRKSHDALIRRVTITADSDGEPTNLLNLLPDDVTSADDQATQKEVVEIVRAALDELPEEQRQTFTMHHFDSLTLSEVADAMDTSLPTAKSRLRLAKEKLRYHLTCRGFAEETVP